MLRALAHAMRHLWPLPTKEEKQIAKLQKQLAALEGKRPQHFGGRQLYLRELVALAKEQKAAGRRLARTVYCDIMQRHGQCWARLPQPMRQSFEAKAALARSDSQQAL
eukprot:12920697-Alexandrium_andersonii.AAC.1